MKKAPVNSKHTSFKSISEDASVERDTLYQDTVFNKNI